MRWIKWTMVTAAGLAPALAFADEPAQPPAKPDPAPKVEIRVLVKDGDGKDQVFQLGAKGKEQDLDKLLGELAKKARFMVEDAQLKHDKPVTQDMVLVRELTDRLANKAMRLAVKREHHKGTYLGVSTSEPPTVLRKHLGLHSGMGLVIDAVMPDSPAAKAGLKEYDVVQKVDDQLIINYEQFTVLIRDHKPGDEVKLSIIHEGKPESVTAKLIEHDIEEVGSASPFPGGNAMFRAFPEAVSTWVFPANPGAAPGEPNAVHIHSHTAQPNTESYELQIQKDGDKK